MAKASMGRRTAKPAAGRPIRFKLDAASRKALAGSGRKEVTLRGKVVGGALVVNRARVGSGGWRPANAPFA